MSDRKSLRCGLFLFVASCLLLVACPRHEPLLCGVQEACPRGFVCSEGLCIKDRELPDACSGYSYANGECQADCQMSGAYADEAACCDAHPDACDNAISRCPAQPPADDEVLVASVDLTCEYGEECCCGTCQPSKICSAFAGEELGCFFTDWCLNQQCQN